MVSVATGSRIKRTCICIFLISALGTSFLWYKWSDYSSPTIFVSGISESNQTAKNWIVVTTITNPSSDIEKLAKTEKSSKDQETTEEDLMTISNWTDSSPVTISSIAGENKTAKSRIIVTNITNPSPDIEQLAKTENSSKDQVTTEELDMMTTSSWTDSSPVTVSNIAVENKTAENWIVVTTVKYPSQNIENLAKIKEWQVLVVGDMGTPSNWSSHPGCIFLGIDQQNSLGFDITSRLPTNSSSRKIIGYLYAIQHGARYIYDADENNEIKGGKLNFNQKNFTKGLIYDYVSDDIMNPYAHFGQPSIWPRGFPLDKADKPNDNTYKLCTFKTPAIQQGLTNGDPDVDAVYRMTKKAPTQRYINVTFDTRAPPVTLPEGVFAPFNSQNTFFAYDAFWALFLPVSPTNRVMDIWRGYWAQRLLWLIGQRLSFSSTTAVQFRNTQDLNDFRDENQFYLQSDSFVKFLKNWTCSESTFFACVSNLGYEMADAQFWAKSDAELLDSWTSDLMTIGYREPKINETTEECLIIKHEQSIHRVYFAPVEQGRIQDSGLRDINRFCDDHFNISSMEMTNSGQRIFPKNVFDDVLLIIVFNFPFYKNIRLLDALYYDHFPNIAYCGQVKSYENLAKEIDQGPFPWRQRQFTFINITVVKGYFTYECVIKAMEMQYEVDSYLLVGDDVMINFWNFEKNRRLKVAQLQIDTYRTINRAQGKFGWMWWGSPLGKKPLEKSLDEFETLARKNPDTIQKDLFSKYLETRNKAKMNMSVVALSIADLYLIPSSLSDIFIQVMKVFLKNKVFLEIAVPNTIVGLNPNVTVDGFLGKSLWGGKRKDPFKFFNSTRDYLHPIKFSALFKTNKTREEYCLKYVTELFKNW